MESMVCVKIVDPETCSFCGKLMRAEITSQEYYNASLRVSGVYKCYNCGKDKKKVTIVI